MTTFGTWRNGAGFVLTMASVVWNLGLAAAEVERGKILEESQPRAEIEPAFGYDSGRLQHYFHIRNSEFSPAWGVYDVWGIGFGRNLGRHWGLELAVETSERDVPTPAGRKAGEESVLTFLPQVRYRRPMLGNRLVPYALFGLGPSVLQFNDKLHFGEVYADGVRFTAALGGGVEYFIADNVAFGIEGKYFWTDPVTLLVDGHRSDFDVSGGIVTLGLRIYFEENHVRPLVEAEPQPSVMDRLVVGFHGGTVVVTEGHWADHVRLRPEASSFGSFVQYYALSVGTYLGRNWSVELVGSNSEYEIHSEVYGRVGEFSVFGVVPTVRYRMPFAEGRWVPFVSLGAGAAYSELNDSRHGDAFDPKSKGFAPMVTAGAGFEYFLLRNVSLSVQADWVHTWSHKLTINGDAARNGAFAMVQVYAGIRATLLEW